MKENKISIEINCTVGKVFEFTLNPKNTPLWIDNIVREERNESSVKVGTEYKNVNGGGSGQSIQLLSSNQISCLR